MARLTDPEIQLEGAEVAYLMETASANFPSSLCNSRGLDESAVAVLVRIGDGAR
jgi:hypothetical protein